MKEKRLSSLKSCLSLLGDAGWFPELDAVLKKKRERRRERQSGREDAEERGRGKREKERKKFPEV